MSESDDEFHDCETDGESIDVPVATVREQRKNINEKEG